MEITFLGTGGSFGIPVIGCDCYVCKSSDLKNKRTRASIVVHHQDLNILIDTSPELRIQAINNNINKVDAILFTHPHYDHIAGLDDIRRFNILQKKTLRCYGNKETLKFIQKAFSYIFGENDTPGSKPKLDAIEVEKNFFVDGVEIIPVHIYHGKMPIYGYKICNFAYITDCSEIPDISKLLLKNLDILIIGALMYKKFPTHFNIEQALNTIAELKPARAYLTHLCHHIEHNTLQESLPENVYVAFDGQKIKTK